MNQFKNPFVAAILSGIGLWLSWPPLPFTWLIFISFIPLLWLADQPEILKKKWKFRLLVFSSMLIWNVATTWWVGKATATGGIFANFMNALLLSLPIFLYQSTRVNLGRTLGYISLPLFWMTLEYLHLRWELSWPWLTMGNVFAGKHSWVQWYEYTGVFGGSLWVWLVNILLYEAFRQERSFKRVSARFSWINSKTFGIATPILLIILPIAISLFRYSTYKEEGTPVNITILQPNVNPYTEKFSTPYRVLIKDMITQSKKGISDSTDFLIWPETAVPYPIWLNRPESSGPLRLLTEQLSIYPNLTTIFGANTFEEYGLIEERTSTTRTLINPRLSDTTWYDAFNTAIQIQADQPLEWYHKSKLVPGAERMPYPQFFRFLEHFSLSLGGISGSLGIKNDRTVFTNKDGFVIGTPICYESVYGEFCSNYVRNGAGMLFIITNDGWWGNTSGYKQHCAYASLRAIENRRSIARSANTGISCFVNQRGDILKATSWDEQVNVTGQILYTNELTFYTKNGDTIGRTACWLAALFYLMSFVKRRTSKLI